MRAHVLTEEGALAIAESGHRWVGDEVAYRRQSHRKVEVRVEVAKTDERCSGVVILSERSKGRDSKGEGRNHE